MLKKRVRSTAGIVAEADRCGVYTSDQPQSGDLVPGRHKKDGSLDSPESQRIKQLQPFYLSDCSGSDQSSVTTFLIVIASSTM